MTRLEMTEREAMTLRDILESYLSDLRTERVATENKEWRADMKEREAIADVLLNRLAAGS